VRNSLCIENKARGSVEMKSSPSWFALLAFCAVATLAVAVGFATLFAGAALAFTVGLPADNDLVSNETASSGQPIQDIQSGNHEASVAKTYSGMVSDSHCMGRHSRYPNKSSTECARMCVRNDSRYMLIDGDKKYALRGSELELDKLAAQRATVTGILDGDTIVVATAGLQQP
jgi:hypothetical protein